MSSTSKGSNIVIMVIGLLTSLLIIQFTGPYLATLKSNPFTGDKELAKAFGYFQATVLEILFAFMLVELHSFKKRSFAKFWMYFIAGLILLVSTSNAMMEDVGPHIKEVISSYAKLQEASLNNEEANRQIKYMSDLGINKNPINAIGTNEKIYNLKMKALTLQRESSNKFPIEEILINFILKLVLVLSNATVFWKLGLNVKKKKDSNQQIATHCNEIVMESEPITTDCNEIVTEDEPVTTHCNEIVMEEQIELATLQIRSDLKDKETVLVQKQVEINLIQGKLQKEEQDKKEALEKLTIARNSLENLETQKSQISSQLAEYKVFDARILTQDYYIQFCRDQNIEVKLQAVADKIFKHTKVKVTTADLSRSAKAGMVMTALEEIKQQAA